MERWSLINLVTAGDWALVGSRSLHLRHQIGCSRAGCGLRPLEISLHTFPPLKLGGRWAAPQYHCALRASSPSPKACLSNWTVAQREWAGYIQTRSAQEQHLGQTCLLIWSSHHITPVLRKCCRSHPPCALCENSEALAAGQRQIFSAPG